MVELANGSSGQGTVVTFYSYKGGVGRTLCLANVAAIVAQWGYRVLCIDWDLEAPGLPLYFAPWVTDTSTPGVVELVAAAAEGGAPDWRKHVIPVELPGAAAPLSLMRAGRPDGEYVRRMQALDWPALYRDHGLGEFLESLRDEWKKSYDLVLVDSRTGVTDIGGICTVQLPDILALLFTANNQSIEGILDVATRAAERRRGLPVDRGGLLTLPVLTRFDSRVEHDDSQKWLDLFAERLPPLYAGWAHRDVPISVLLDQTRIPYIPKWSFGERLPVIEQGTQAPDSIGFVLETLASLIALRLGESHLLVRSRDTLVATARRNAAAMRRPEERFRHDVFLSHGRSEAPLAEALERGLTAKGYRVFSSPMGTYEGGRYGPPPVARSGATPLADVLDALEASQHMVVLLGREAGTTQAYEWRQFMTAVLDESSASRRIVPVLTVERDPSSIPEIFRNVVALQAAGLSSEAVVDAVVAALEATASPTSPPPGPEFPREAAAPVAKGPAPARSWRGPTTWIGLSSVLVTLLVAFESHRTQVREDARRMCELGAASGPEVLAACAKACQDGSAEHCRRWGDALRKQGAKDPAAQKQAAQAYESACTGHDLEGCAELGTSYMKGDGVTKDEAKAVALDTRSCDGGHPPACSVLGELYEHGKAGLTLDEARAGQLYTKGCNGDDPAGCAGLGALLVHGHGGRAKDEKRAADLLVNACVAGAMRGCVGEGRLYEHGLGGLAKDKVRAVQAYRTACDGADLEGCAELGSMMKVGLGGLAKDAAQAMQLFTKACDGGAFLGCEYLGDAYYDGVGVPQDKSKAYDLYRTPCPGQVADCADLTACANIAVLLSFGEGGLREDDALGVELSQRACDGDEMNACSQLGFDYEHGRGVPWDMHKALELYRKACDGGCAAGCTNLGTSYYGGVGVPPDAARAATLFASSCQDGEPAACSWLGSMYAEGTGGLPKDYGKAAQLQQGACNDGRAAGCVELGHLYEAGNGVPKDTSRAAALMTMACDRDAASCGHVGNLYYSGQDGETRNQRKAAEFYRKACDAEEAGSCYNLANILVWSDRPAAVELYQRACKENVAGACQKVKGLVGVADHSRRE